MKIRSISSLSILLMASACQVISFFPLFTPEVVVERNELQGVYASEDDKAIHLYSNSSVWEAMEAKKFTADSALELSQTINIPPYLTKLLLDLAESPKPEGDWDPEATQHYFPFLKHGYFLVEDQYPNEPFPAHTGNQQDYFNFIARFKIYRMVLVELDEQLYADTWPVVATAFSPDIMSFQDVIYLADDAKAFAQAIDLAVDSYQNQSPEPRYQKALANTWEVRVERLWEILAARTKA